MTKQFERKRITVQVLKWLKCNRCKRKVAAEDTIASQEWISVGGSGGYGSTHWGDGTRWTVDLCERCQFELFNEIAATESN